MGSAAAEAADVAAPMPGTAPTTPAVTTAAAATVVMMAPAVSARIFTKVCPRSSSVTGLPPPHGAGFHMCVYLAISLV